MELAIIIVIAVIVLVLLFVAVVFCRSAGKAESEFFVTSVHSPTGSSQDYSNQSMQQQQQQQQQPPPPPSRFPSQMATMQMQPFPSHLQFTREQMQQMSPQQLAHLTQMQQLWQMQQPPMPLHPMRQTAPLGQQQQQVRQQQQQQQQQMINNAQAASLSASQIKSNTQQETAKYFPQLLDHRLDQNEVIMTRKISTGSFGIVWLGHYHGQPVAVKKMINIDDDEAQLFAREILIMARMQHPKIVQFLGCTWTHPSDLGAVTEFMNGGDVRSLLENKRIALRWSHEKISIAIDVAEAIKYIHTLSPKLIHRDLKSRNVLLNAKLVAKLSDFGLSRNRTYEQTLTAGVGTVRWTAPEVILGENYSEQADIYSFGVVLSELDTREIPFEETRDAGGGMGGVDTSIVIKVARGELRPSFSATVPPCIDRIAKACLQFDPALRPTATQVLVLLMDAKTELIK